MSQILLSGFTFIRNAIKYDFPIRECIQSMLPVVDELVVNVGKSEDGTEDLLRSIAATSPKIKLVFSVWDDAKTERGLVLSQQTNIALDACSGKWCLYLQADEAIHEKDHALIRKAVEDESLRSDQCDGFRFPYLHFYAGYRLVQHPWNWYPSEIRIIRKDSGARSFGDAQTFRIGASDDDNAPKLKTLWLPAHVYHYGHARDPIQMQQKIKYFHRFWHGDNHGIQVNSAYNKDLKNLVWFWSTHPIAYRERVNVGLSHSIRPSDVMPAIRPEQVFILAGGLEHSLAEEVLSLLKVYGYDGGKSRVIHGFFDWTKTVCKYAFRRKKPALIDLAASHRPALIWIFFLSDAFFGFSRRIAHVPGGKLNRWFSKIYSAISWGSHENAREGFRVPEDQYARQLVRWLGIDC